MSSKLDYFVVEALKTITFNNTISFAGTDSKTITANGNLTISADTTLTGKATNSDLTTGTDDTKFVTSAGFQGSSRNIRTVMYRVLDSTTSTTASTSSAIGGDLELPISGTITEVGAYVDTAGTGNFTTVDLHYSGTTIMSTNKLLIEASEKSTRTCGLTAYTLTTTAVTAGSIINVYCDTIATTAAKGLTAWLKIRET
jgi:hypothetical protein